MTDSCKHVLRVKTSIQLGILTPEQWHCNTCHTTESVWACLSCSNFACGRYIAEHSLKHFESTGHPLCIEVNEKFVFCYLCDDFVLNDNAPGDIKLLQMALDAVSAQDFHELSKQKRGRRILRYHVRDAKKHTAPFASFVMSHTLQEVSSQSRKRRQDLSASDPNVCPSKRFLLSPVGGVRPTESTRSLLAYPLDTNSVPLSVSDAPCDMLRNPQTIPSGEKLSNFQPMSPLIGGLHGGQCSVKSNSFPTSSTPQSVVTPDPSLYEEMHNLFHTLWSGQRTVVSPSNLLYAVWTALPTFKGYKQQDAQEFLSLLLDRLQAELHGVPVHLLSNTRDFINRTFQGYSVSHVRCSACNVTACTEEPIYELSLSLPLNCYSGEATECDLVDLLRQFVSPSPIDGSSYACRECNRRSIKEIEPENKYTLPNGADFESGSCSPNPASFNVDKYVSISLSRLSSPTAIIPTDHLRLPDFTESSSSSSSLSESALSTSPSLASLDDIEERIPIKEERSTVHQNNELVQSPFSPLLNPTRNKSPCSPVKSPFRTPATQTIRLCRLPRVLRLHIKRFRWVGRQREKLACHVAFPLILDMTEFMLRDIDRTQCGQVHAHDDQASHNQKPEIANSDRINISRSRSYSTSACTSNVTSHERQHLYHLTGVVVHHGRGFQSGHYTAYCLNDEPECWLHCNDAHVTLCDFDEVATAQAYLLFYSELMPKAPYPMWLNSPVRGSFFDKNKTTSSTNSLSSPLLQLRRNSSVIPFSSNAILTHNESDVDEASGAIVTPTVTTNNTTESNNHQQGTEQETKSIEDAAFPNPDGLLQSRRRHSSSWTQTC